MTNYTRCPFCQAVRRLYSMIDGHYVRICYACFAIQKGLPVKNTSPARAAVSLVLVCSLMAGPVWAEQVVLDGQEFRAHVERDQRIKADRDNLEQQVGLYRQNETHYKRTVTALKELQAKTDEKVKAQDGLIATYEAQRVAVAQQHQELAAEVQRVKREKDELTWAERGKGFGAGLLAMGAVAVYLLRGGR